MVSPHLYLLLPLQAVTGMVYSNVNPAWPSNGNGNAFVLPVRRSKRQTDLVITVWDGRQYMQQTQKIHAADVNAAVLAYPCRCVCIKRGKRGAVVAREERCAMNM